jgi:hypothetical protein
MLTCPGSWCIVGHTVIGYFTSLRAPTGGGNAFGPARATIRAFSEAGLFAATSVHTCLVG